MYASPRANPPGPPLNWPWCSRVSVTVGGGPVRRNLHSFPDVRLGSLDDHDLVGRAARGDERAFGELVSRHHGSLWRLARTMLRNDHDAQEITQDSLLSAWRHLDQFRGESSVRTWLHTICHRQCLARLRRRRHDLVALDDATATLAAVSRDDADRVALTAAIDGLPEDNRVAFTLVHVLGFSREDAAKMAGVAGNTMRARVARAVVLLADALDETEPSTGAT